MHCFPGRRNVHYSATPTWSTVLVAEHLCRVTVSGSLKNSKGGSNCRSADAGCSMFLQFVLF